MRYLSFSVAYLFTVFAVLANAPSGYYSSLDGKSGETLKNQLHNIIAPHTQLTYSSLWDYFPQTDVYPDKADGKAIVWDMYSDNWNIKKYYYPNRTGGLNREHSVPKSWWGNSGSANSDIEKFLAGTDITHLFPSDGTANMAKSNYPLGETESATFDNGVTKVGYAKSGMGGGASYVFEPGDEYKGDFARVYFYMATCYQEYTWKYTYMFINTSYLSLKPWAYNMLLEWSRNDPVSQKEIDRNEAVYKIQGNRNPFIDDPDLVEYIWGTKQGQVYTADHPTGDPILISPVQDNELNIGEVALGSSQHVDLYVKGENLSNNLTVTIWKDDESMFKAAVNSISAANANKDDGYKLRITYTPTAIGDHSTRLVLSDGGLTGSIGVSIKGSCLPVPSLSQLTALAPSNVTSNSYRAEWTAATEDIDHYVITRKTYEGSTVTTDEIMADENYYDFDDLKDGTKQTYFVQSSRLGYRSVESNVITIDNTSVNGVATDKPLAVATYTGGIVRFICSEPHTGCKIYDIQGRLIKVLSEIANNSTTELHLGAYLVTTDQSKRPVKVLVK